MLRCCATTIAKNPTVGPESFGGTGGRRGGGGDPDGRTSATEVERYEEVLDRTVFLRISHVLGSFAFSGGATMCDAIAEVTSIPK